MCALLKKRVLKGFTWLLAASIAVGLCVSIAACSSESSTQTALTEAAGSETSETATSVRVASLTGPTSIGLVEMMDQAAAGELAADYEFTIASVADEVTTGLIQGELDIALLPANTASVVYNRTEGGISVISINTLGVLYVVTGDESVNSLADLAGKTIYTTGKGTTPEYALNYVLEQSGLADQVTVEFRSESTELAAILNEDPSAICLLPEPFATATLTSNDSLRRVVSLTDEWDSIQGEDGSALVTGVTVVRTEFLEENPELVASFLEAQQASVSYVNDNPEEAGQLVAEAGIIDSPTVAASAIPNCSLVCITGEEMQTKLEGYLQVLFDQDASSVGGALPAADFYVTS